MRRTAMKLSRERVSGFMRGLKLAGHYAWKEGGGWKGALSQFVFLLSLLEVLVAVLYSPLEWMGFHQKEPRPPHWLTILCAGVVLSFSPVGKHLVNLCHAVRLPREERKRAGEK